MAEGRARQGSLGEAAARRSRKGKGLLGTAEAEKLAFYPSFARHKVREPPAAAVGARLSTCRPALAREPRSGRSPGGSARSPAGLEAQDRGAAARARPGMRSLLGLC